MNICTSPPSANSYMERHSGPSDAGTYMLQGRRLELKELKSFILCSKPADLCPGGRETLFPSDWTVKKPAICSGWGHSFCLPRLLENPWRYTELLNSETRLNVILSSFSSSSLSFIEVVEICSFFCRIHLFVHKQCFQPYLSWNFLITANDEICISWIWKCYGFLKKVWKKRNVYRTLAQGTESNLNYFNLNIALHNFLLS